jgi:hypothetical protein
MVDHKGSRDQGVMRIGLLWLSVSIEVRISEIEHNFCRRVFDSHHLAIDEHEMHHNRIYKRIDCRDLQSIRCFSRLLSIYATSLEYRFDGN